MIEIYENLFIGNQYDFENNIRNRFDWATVHACKEPYHRILLGYKSRGAPKNHPEYFFAERGNRLYLNLIDTEDPKYIPEVIINKALEFITSKIINHKTLVHCNQGESRSPVIGLLYLASIGYFDKVTFNEAENKYKSLYKFYNPKNGIRTFAINNWYKYIKMGE
ncbi:MAG: phosphatase [Candidatus Cloacimonas sp. SDB]|nr:MAG: phosphatase [Candidatus Cloacimonas sp. SDB]